MKKLALLVSMFVLVALFSSLHAQDYKSAIGVKLGYPFGVTYKFFVSEPAAIDLYVGTRYSGVTFGGNYEIHKPLPNAEGFKWYLGGGALFTFYDYAGVGSSNVGVDGIVGIDYKFPDAPFNLSLDVSPTYLFGADYYGGFEIFGGVSARYVLK